MKKLLMKWFPKYFTINTTKWLKVEDLGQVDGLKVIEVNPEDNTLTGGLGITDERAEEMQNRLKFSSYSVTML